MNGYERMDFLYEVNAKPHGTRFQFLRLTFGGKACETSRPCVRHALATDTRLDSNYYLYNNSDAVVLYLQFTHGFDNGVWYCTFFR